MMSLVKRHHMLLVKSEAKLTAPFCCLLAELVSQKKINISDDIENLLKYVYLSATQKNHCL